MKLGLGLYKGLLSTDNYRFAVQAGATHLVVQLVDYIKGGDSPSLMQDYLAGWGVTPNVGKLWSYDELLALRKSVEAEGLTLEAIENFDPAHWYDILLDGPRKNQQFEDLKTLIRNIGKAGIPIMGYYFSLAGVWGWTAGPSGRGGAKSVEFIQNNVDIEQPIPNGMAWNMTYDTSAKPGFVAEVTREEIWGRYKEFLKILIPIAQENNVRLVAHPDDPPLPELRKTARLFYSHAEYEKLLTIDSSANHGMEFCLGTLQEMQDGDVYTLLERHASANNIGYIHFRNVKGKVPHYREVFVDEGDIDMVRVMKILQRCNYDGVIIPDHTPEMICKAPWHAGMAYALGYMKGVMQSIKDNNE